MKDNKKKRRITHFIAIVSCFLIALTFFGCGKKPAEEPELPTEYTEEEILEDESVEKTEINKESKPEEKPQDTQSGVETFALFGVDTRAKNLGKGTRSDSLMIAVLNHDTKKIRIASVFRDTLVEVEGHGLTKLTHAHSYGGPDLAVDTLNRNFDMDIKDYVTVNFINMRDLVDELGGIEMDITESEAKYINNYINELNRINETSSEKITKAGHYTLDGNQAVAYSRIRYTAGGDYKRAERQRAVLSQIFKKVKETDTKDAILLMTKMINDVNTNCSQDKVISLLYYLSDYEIDETKSFPRKLWGGKLSSLSNLWYAVPVTLESTTQDLHKFLYNEEDYKVSDKVKSISDEIKGYADEPNEVLEEDPSLKEYNGRN